MLCNYFVVCYRLAYRLRYTKASDGKLLHKREGAMKAEPMILDETICDDVVILKLHGMLANRPNMNAFYQRLTQLEQAGHTRVVVDFSGVISLNTVPSSNGINPVKSSLSLAMLQCDQPP